MPQAPKPLLTPDSARQLLAGQMPLSALFGVSPGQLADMASFGHQLWRQGRRPEAEKIFRGLIALDEKTYYGHAGLGLVAMSNEDLVTAELHLRKAVELEPNDASVAVNLGEVLLRQGKLEAALAALEAASKIDSSGANPGSTRARAILAGIGHGAAEIRKNTTATR
jgi:Flp pilus assembly protein TadD